MAKSGGFVIDVELLRDLRSVDSSIFFDARNSGCHPANTISRLIGTVGTLLQRLEFSGRDLLKALCWNQLLTLATLHQFSIYNGEPSQKDFSLLLQLYEETGRFDLAQQFIATDERVLSNHYRAVVRKFKARHQIQDLRELAGPPCSSSAGDCVVIFVVNMPADVYRLARFSARCREIGVQFIVQPGFSPADVLRVSSDFKRLPLFGLDDNTSSLTTFTKQDLDALRRAGNKIAQYNAWMQIKCQQISHALILEDDAWLDRRVVDLKPSDNRSGITFVNDRIVRHCRWQATEASCPVSVASLSDPAIDFPYDNADIRAPGSDGYLLSNSGANQLISIIDSNGIPSGGTDWFLLKCSLDAKTLRPSIFRERLSSFQNKEPVIDPSGLNSLVTSCPLTYHQPFSHFMSTR